MAIGLSTTVRNNRLTQIVNALDGGAGNGTLKFYDGTRPATGGTATGGPTTGTMAVLIDGPYLNAAGDAGYVAPTGGGIRTRRVHQVEARFKAHTGTMAATLEAPVFHASGSLGAVPVRESVRVQVQFPRIGTLQTSLEDPITAGAGAVGHRGAFAAALPAPGFAAEGGFRVEGVAAALLDAPQFVASGLVEYDDLEEIALALLMLRRAA